MNYDLDDDAEAFINQEADTYVPFQELLLQHGLTIGEALQQSADFQKTYVQLSEKHQIDNRNLVSACYTLMKQIRQSPRNQELQWLYAFIVTDTSGLHVQKAEKQTKEQIICNYFQQSKKVKLLMDSIKAEAECSTQLYQITGSLKSKDSIENTMDLQELELLIELTNQHTFLYGAAKKQNYRDNLSSLLMHLNSNDNLKTIKPYLLFAMLSRKHGMMQNRAYYMPNLLTAFQYQEYQIYEDNGKNFNLYQSYLELYDHLRCSYEEDDTVNISLCDYCFAHFSPLSEWYYLYCQPDIAIPMKLRQKVKELEPLTFPMLYDYETYSDCDVTAFEETHGEICQIWDMAIDEAAAESVLQAIWHNTAMTDAAKKIPYYEKYPRFAELFLLEAAERQLEEKMLCIADLITE